MKLRLCLLFIYSAGLLICIAALAKVVSSFGTDRVLHMPDPIFGIAFSNVFRMVGCFELCICCIIVLTNGLLTRVGLVAMLATSFVIYRLGLLWIGYHKPCPCLGNLTGVIHIPTQVAEIAMRVIVAYLFIGSYTTCLYLLLNIRKLAVDEIDTGKQASQARLTN